jgi:hypothetical protein
MRFKLTQSKILAISGLVFIILASCKSKKVTNDTPVEKTDTFYHGIELNLRGLPVRVYRWNMQNYDSIMKRERFNLLIKEVIDDSNRVKQIEFLRKGQPTDFYDFPISKVAYDYDKDKIIETLYDEDGNTLFVDKHVSHYQSIYYLDADKYIMDVERTSDLVKRDSVYTELAGGPTPIEELQEDVKYFFERYYKGKPLEVEFYKYSYYKMDGVYPVSKDFTIDTLKYDWQRRNPRKIKGKIVFDTLYIPTLIQEEIENGFQKLKSQN